MTRRLAAPLAYGLLLAALIAAALAGRSRARAVPDLSRWDALIVKAAGEFDLDANLLRGLVATESGGDPDAVSHAGAIGLLQLMPATAREQAERLRVREYEESRLPDPALNLRLGASFLARLLARYDGEEAFALAAYNAGPTRVNRWRESAPNLSARDVIRTAGYAETRAHLERVFRYRAAYRERYGSP